MTKPLDPRFIKIVALMNSTAHEGEKAAARTRAEAVAKSCGMTFDQAMAASKVQPAQPKPFVNIMDGWDDWMEEKEPGYKARRAKEKSDKASARRARVKILMQKYGSEEAGLAPCEKEKLLHKALKPWLKYCKRPHQRWTYSVGGSGAYWLFDFKDSPYIREAVANAYPLPTTFQEAMLEYEYWNERRIEMEDLLDGLCGDEPLDRPASLRRDLIEDLLIKDMVLTTLPDLLARLKFARKRENSWEGTEDAVFRDLEAMVKAQADPSNLSTGSKGPQNVRGDVSSAGGQMACSTHICPTPNGQIEEMLGADASQSDRSIARACRCSPTTVGKVRSKLGLAQPVRSVQRRGQRYQMRAVKTG